MNITIVSHGPNSSQCPHSLANEILGHEGILQTKCGSQSSLKSFTRSLKNGIDHFYKVQLVTSMITFALLIN